MNRTEKEAFVESFREQVESAPVVYLTDFTGLDVKSITVLRQQLKASRTYPNGSRAPLA